MEFSLSGMLMLILSINGLDSNKNSFERFFTCSNTLLLLCFKAVAIVSSPSLSLAMSPLSVEF